MKIPQQQQIKGSLSNYNKVCKLGEGSYGSVFLYQRTKFEDNDTFHQFFVNYRKPQSNYFALKRFNSPQDLKQGLDLSSLREINLLSTVDHPHITSCYEIIYRKTPKRFEVYTVMDFHLQLRTVLGSPDLEINDIVKKNICYQMLLGVSFLHQNFLFHRDLKPENIFCSRSGHIKLADFGFTKQFGTPYKQYTAGTCTKDYRAPQIFYGTHYYTEKADIWSFGCVVAYVFMNRTLFGVSSTNDLQTLSRIFYLRGTPTVHPHLLQEQTWSHFKEFPKYVQFTQCQPKYLSKELQISEELADFLDCSLQLDPKKRFSAQQLLKHKFFNSIRPQPLKVEEVFQKALKALDRKVKGIDNQQ